MSHHYHVGRKTHAFDVLGRDLLIAAYHAGQKGGQVFELAEGGSEHQLQPVSENGKAHAGHRAFSVRDGGVYRVVGVEMRPVAVERYVSYDQGIGFSELSEEAARSLVGRSLPELHGSPRQCLWAADIRKKALAGIRSPQLAAGLKGQVSAKWWIARQHNTPDQWLHEAERLAPGSESEALR